MNWFLIQVSLWPVMLGVQILAAWLGVVEKGKLTRPVKAACYRRALDLIASGDSRRAARWLILGYSIRPAQIIVLLALQIPFWFLMFTGGISDSLGQQVNIFGFLIPMIGLYVDDILTGIDKDKWKRKAKALRNKIKWKWLPAPMPVPHH